MAIDLSNDTGIRILSAHAFPGGLYADFEIRTDATGGYERWRWQGAGAQAKLWMAVAKDDQRLIAEGELGTWSAVREVLGRVHSARNVLTYGEFVYFVRGWIAGSTDAHPR